MPVIEPPCLPKVGDAVVVAHEGEWQDAEVTGVTPLTVSGVVLHQRHPTSFAYTIASYRAHWRFR